MSRCRLLARDRNGRLWIKLQLVKGNRIIQFVAGCQQTRLLFAFRFAGRKSDANRPRVFATSLFLHTAVDRPIMQTFMQKSFHWHKEANIFAFTLNLLRLQV